VKITKDFASRVFTPSFSSPLPSHGEDSETKPVHTVVADRDTVGSEYFSAAQNPAKERLRQRLPDRVPSMGEERRQHERRQHQVYVVLDTRVASSRRQNQSISAEA
jgi:hypothetical protein